MPNYNWKGDQAKADLFQAKWDLWIDECKKFAPVLNMDSDDIKRLYVINPLFRQFVECTKTQNRYLEKILNSFEAGDGI